MVLSVFSESSSSSRIFSPSLSRWLMRGVLAGLLFSSSASTVFAGEEPDPQVKKLQDDVARLERLIKQLETRVQELERRPSAGAGAAGAGAPVEDRPVVIDVSSSPVLGPADAGITIVSFLDYQCPFCARMFPTLQNLLNDPELNSNVRIVFKHMPLAFHKDARPAAKAALAAREQGKFWEYSQKLFENQRSLNEETFSRLAADLQLDVRKFENDLREKDEKFEEIISADERIAQQVGAKGTPTSFANGWIIVGARDAESIKGVMKSKNIDFAARAGKANTNAADKNNKNNKDDKDDDKDDKGGKKIKKTKIK